VLHSRQVQYELIVFAIFMHFGSRQMLSKGKLLLKLLLQPIEYGNWGGGLQSQHGEINEVLRSPGINPGADTFALLE